MQSSPRTDPLIRVALLLAFFLMIWPTEADFVFSGLHARDFLGVTIVLIVVPLVVFIPVALSLVRIKRHPDKFKGKGWIVLIGIVVIATRCLHIAVIVEAMKTSTTKSQTTGAEVAIPHKR